jgi:hypothetical protein
MRAPFKCDPGSVIVLRRLAMRGGFHRWRGLSRIFGKSNAICEGGYWVANGGGLPP